MDFKTHVFMQYPVRFKTLYNHDGWCLFSNGSRYQDISESVNLDQVKGYVDEVADAGCDALLLCPNMYQLPGWDSEHYSFWREAGKKRCFENGTAVGVTLSRFQEFLSRGQDFIRVSGERARERGMGFLLSWRMNECHGVDRDTCPSHSDFWRAHPEFRIGSSSKGIELEKNALSFMHQEVREYQMGFILELIDRYDLDGMELDFLRFPYFFPANVPFEMKAPVMTDFVSEVRSALNRKAGSERKALLGVRVSDNPVLVYEMGLDLNALVDGGLIDMINLSPFYITNPDNDIESFAMQYGGKCSIYAEITHCMQMIEQLELSLELCRKTSPEMFYALAESYYARGADGISFFNLTYTRDYSLAFHQKPDRVEPVLFPIGVVKDRERLMNSDKHYFIVEGGVPEEGWPKSRQLPAELIPEEVRVIEIHLGDTDFERYFGCVLRLMFKDPAEQRDVHAFVSGRKLRGTIVAGELFQCPFVEGVPEGNEYYLDFDVPLSYLRHGWNKFSFYSKCEHNQRVIRMEVALYQKRRDAHGTHGGKDEH